MAKAHLRTKTGIALALALVFHPFEGRAATAVIDPQAIAKLTQQINLIKEQFEVITDISRGIQATIDVIGEMTKFQLPFIDLIRLGRNIKRDAQCLKPDLSDLMPGLVYDEIDIGTICAGKNFYRKKYWVNNHSLFGKSWGARHQARQQVVQRRHRLVQQATTTGIAQSDAAIKANEELNKAADELDDRLDDAKSTNELLLIIGKGQILTVRAIAQNNQLTAQLLRVNSANGIAGSPINNIPKATTPGAPGQTPTPAKPK